MHAQLSCIAQLQGDIGGILWAHDTIPVSRRLMTLAIVNAGHAVSARFEHAVTEVPIPAEDGTIIGRGSRTYAYAHHFSTS